MSAFATPSELGRRPARRTFMTLGAAAAAAGVLSACAKPAKPLRIIVAGSAGSSTDAIARLFGRHLTRLFGDKVEFENEPRAIGKVAMQKLVQSDGTRDTMAFLQNGLLYGALTGEGLPWDLASLGWLGSFNVEHRVLISAPSAKVERFEALFDRPKPLILICGAAGSSASFESRILSYLTPAKIRLVPGFNGAARNLALVSGEGEGTVGSLDALAPILEMPGGRLLLRMNDMPLDTASAARGWSAPPLAAFASGPDKDVLLALIDAHAKLGRMAAMPPGTPAAVLQQWREKLDKVSADPLFRSEGTKHNLLIEPVSGQQISDDLHSLLSGRSDAVRAALARALA